jgi:hypothetical protein
MSATLHLPAGTAASVALLDGGDPAVAALAAALLASRGVLVLHVTEGGLEAARERLAAVPAAAEAPPRIVAAGHLLPPGVPATTAADAGAWDALLADLGATPRGTP